MSKVSQQPILRRMERWVVGLVMAAVAFMIEKAILRSIRRTPAKPKSNMSTEP